MGGGTQGYGLTPEEIGTDGHRAQKVAGKS